MAIREVGRDGRDLEQTCVCAPGGCVCRCYRGQSFLSCPGGTRLAEPGDSGRRVPQSEERKDRRRAASCLGGLGLERRRTVLVTGANTGIGKVIASRLALAGYDVAVNYKVDEPAATKLAADLERASSGRAVAVYADVGRRQDVEHMFG